MQHADHCASVYNRCHVIPLTILAFTVQTVTGLLINNISVLPMYEVSALLRVSQFHTTLEQSTC